jgi:hypothetical protein
MTTAAQEGQSALAEEMQGRGRKVTLQVMTWQVVMQGAVMQPSSSSKTGQSGTGLAAEVTLLICRTTAEAQTAASTVSPVIRLLQYCALGVAIATVA